MFTVQVIKIIQIQIILTLNFRVETVYFLCFCSGDVTFILGTNNKEKNTRKIHIIGTTNNNNNKNERKKGCETNDKHICLHICSNLLKI